MMRIWRTHNVVEAIHLRNVLESAGIGSLLRNENLSRLAGEVPLDQTWPEIWIVDESRSMEALALLQEVQRPSNRHHWTCGKCGEWLEGQFTSCWSCGCET